MTKALTKKKLILAIAGLLLLTFCIPASSHAAGVILVPAAGLAIWGVTVVAAGLAAIFDGDDENVEDAQTRKKPGGADRRSDADVHQGAPTPNEG